MNIPQNVQFIIDTFYRNGYEAFAVGGCVRDSLLNKEPLDYDITTSALPEITEKLFSHTIPTGIKHGTITIVLNKETYEVTTYRTEGKYLDNRKPSSVKFVSNIRDDLSRRDFTINALAYNKAQGLLDYFNGQNDLNNKIIRCVGNADKRFKEDALRMLRAVRFSSQLGFIIEEKTYNAIHDNSHLIANISNERIRSEFSKIILSPNAYLGLKNLLNTKLLNYIFPFEINLSDKIDELPNDLSTRLAFLYKNCELNNFIETLKSLTFDNKTINKTELLLKYYDDISSCHNKYECKILINNVTTSNIFDLISLYEINTNSKITELKNTVTAILENHEPLKIKDLKINGNDLKNNLSIKDGKLIGETLNHLLTLILQEKIQNDYSILFAEGKNFIKKLENDKY